MNLRVATNYSLDDGQFPSVIIPRLRSRMIGGKSLVASVFLTFFLISSSLVSAQTDTVTYELACLGDPTEMRAQSSLPDSAISVWEWDLDLDGQYDDAFGKLVYFTFPNPDTNYVSLRITPISGSPITLDSVIIVVWPLPQVNFTVDNNCEFQAAEFFDQSTITNGSIVNWYWDFDNNGVTDDNTGPNTTWTTGPATTYTSRLEVESNNGCRAFADKTVEVFPNPVGNFMVTNFCLGEASTFTNQTTLGGDTVAFYYWDLGDGTQEVVQNPVHTYQLDGNYTVSLVIVSQNDCRDTVVQSIDILPEPNFSLTFSNGDSIIPVGGELGLSVLGAATSYAWSTGESTADITVNTGGVYTVTVDDANGCVKTLSATVTEVSTEVVVLNEILTPNNDGFNDYLIIDNIGIYDQCQVVIFNRWNDKVYENNDYQNDWDGTYEGSPLSAGTYFYIITCDAEAAVQGSINILR